MSSLGDVDPVRGLLGQVVGQIRADHDQAVLAPQEGAYGAGRLLRADPAHRQWHHGNTGQESSAGKKR